MYDQILKNILQNKTLKIEKSIPDPELVNDFQNNQNQRIN
jgi:hypothetical protein